MFFAQNLTYERCLGESDLLEPQETSQPTNNNFPIIINVILTTYTIHIDLYTEKNSAT